MAINSQSILNESWYNRLRRGISEGANSAIRSTGSQPDDPFWKAREAQGIGDLANQRQDAYRGIMEQGNAVRAAGYARDKAYQQRASWGLKNMRPEEGPATYLGTQGEDMGVAGPSMPQPNADALPGPLPAPEAYKAPYSGVSQPAYNPGQFGNPALDRRQRELDAYYARLAKGWR